MTQRLVSSSSSPLSSEIVFLFHSFLKLFLLSSPCEIWSPPLCVFHCHCCVVLQHLCHSKNKEDGHRNDVEVIHSPVNLACVYFSSHFSFNLNLIKQQQIKTELEWSSVQQLAGISEDDTEKPPLPLATSCHWQTARVVIIALYPGCLSQEASASLFLSLGLMIYSSFSTSRGFITTTPLRNAPSCRKDWSKELHHFFRYGYLSRTTVPCLLDSRAIEQPWSDKRQAFFEQRWTQIALSSVLPTSSRETLEPLLENSCFRSSWREEGGVVFVPCIH